MGMLDTFIPSQAMASSATPEQAMNFNSGAQRADEEPSAKTKAGLPLPVKYPQWVNYKFEPDGAVRPFAGNTILSHVPKESDMYRSLVQIHREINGSDFAGLFALLPPESYHTTILEGVCDAIRDQNHWPRDLPLNAPLCECTRLFESKLAEFDIGDHSRFRMAVKGWTALEDGIGLHVMPVDDAEEVRLLSLRDILSECLELRLPNHVGYDLHVSIGYSLRFLTEKEEQHITAFLNAQLSKLPSTFELGPVEFCTFSDMFAFERVRLLGGQS